MVSLHESWGFEAQIEALVLAMALPRKAGLSFGHHQPLSLGEKGMVLQAVVRKRGQRNQDVSACEAQDHGVRYRPGEPVCCWASLSLL